MNLVQAFLRNAPVEARKAADLANTLSFGKDGKTALMANVTTTRFGYTLINRTNDEKLVIIAGAPAGATLDTAPWTSVLQNITGIAPNQFSIIGVNEPGDTVPNFETIAKNSDRSINFWRYFTSISPSQIRFLHLKSTNLSNVEESTNYDGFIKTWHATPFEKEVSTQQIDFSDGQLSSDNRVGLMKVDLMGRGYNVIAGNEGIVAITLKPNTKLSVDMMIGAQISLHQQLHRKVNGMIKYLRPFFKATSDKSTSCAC